MKRLTQLISLLLILGFTASCASRQQSTRGTQKQEVSSEPIAVQEVIAFSKNSNVRGAVKEECKLQTKTPQFVQKFGKREGLDVRLVEDLNNTSIDKKLELTITEAHAPAGGGFSGLKWMIVDGTLYNDGRRVADVKSRRNTTGGYFSAYKGTCDIIGRSTEAIGQDFARWLTDPQDGARLGDL